MNSKKLIFAVLSLAMSFLASCANAAVSVTSSLDKSTAPSGAPSFAVYQDQIATINSYTVVFKKVEIGNSESDKFILWQNDSGIAKDIAQNFSFEGVNKAVPGKYKFIRLTIDTNLLLNLTITNGGTNVNGFVTNSRGVNAVQLFGVAGSGASGKGLLSDLINVYDGASVNFVFAVKNTVWVSNDTLGAMRPDITVNTK